MATHFRVRSRIIGGSDLIRAFGDDAAVFHDNRAEGSAASRVDVVNRELNGTGHERIVHVVGQCCAYLCLASGYAGASDSLTRKSVDMDSFAAAFAEKRV